MGRWVLAGGVAYCLMGVGRVIFSAPMFFLCLTVIISIVGWFCGEAAYDAIGNVLAMLAILAVVMGIGIGVASGPVNGMLACLGILFIGGVVGGLRDGLTERPWKSIAEVLEEQRAASAPLDAKLRAERYRLSGTVDPDLPTPAPTISPHAYERRPAPNYNYTAEQTAPPPVYTAPVYTAPPKPVAPQPYVLKNWAN